MKKIPQREKNPSEIKKISQREKKNPSERKKSLR
jgi:hypothetical protein